MCWQTIYELNCQVFVMVLLLNLISLQSRWTMKRHEYTVHGIGTPLTSDDVCNRWVKFIVFGNLNQILSDLTYPAAILQDPPACNAGQCNNQDVIPALPLNNQDVIRPLPPGRWGLSVLIVPTRRTPQSTTTWALTISAVSWGRTSPPQASSIPCCR